MSPSPAALPEVRRFETTSGVRIYRNFLRAFPGFVVHVYLVLEAGVPTLIDAGSGFGDANQQLLAGLEQGRAPSSAKVGHPRRHPADHHHARPHRSLRRLGVPARADAQAEIAIHQLDARILTAFEERVAVAKKAIHQFLQAGRRRAAHAAGLHGRLRLLETEHAQPARGPHAGRQRQEWDGMRFIHTPGHCPGQVCIALGDVLFSADHVLPEISPHQAPESIMPYTGLGHYLESLDKIGRDRGHSTLTLGGHQGPIARSLQAGSSRIHSPRPRAQAGKNAGHDSRIARAADDQRDLAAALLARQGLSRAAGASKRSPRTSSISINAQRLAIADLGKVQARRKSGRCAIRRGLRHCTARSRASRRSAGLRCDRPTFRCGECGPRPGSFGLALATTSGCSSATLWSSCRSSWLRSYSSSRLAGLVADGFPVAHAHRLAEAALVEFPVEIFVVPVAGGRRQLRPAASAPSKCRRCPRAARRRPTRPTWASVPEGPGLASSSTRQRSGRASGRSSARECRLRTVPA